VWHCRTIPISVLATLDPAGKPGVLLVTSGPGATNLVTPLADAMMDGTPLVALTGQVATGAIGTDAFQEADVVRRRAGRRTGDASSSDNWPTRASGRALAVSP
jgi:hypothetical protein